MALSYDTWINRVDLVLIERLGVSHSEIADHPLIDWFEDGMSPSEAAEAVIEDEFGD